MTVSKLRVAVDDLATGMFVCELDRPWCQTPFPLQGFFIREEQDLQSMKRFCQFVYIDLPLSKCEPEKLKQPEKQLSIEPVDRASRSKKSTTEDSDSDAVKVAPIKLRAPVKYKTTVTMSKALKQANHLLHDIDKTICQLYQSVSAGNAPDIITAKQISGRLVSSVVENPNALTWLVRIQNKDSHTYYHAISACIWSLVLGRKIGLEVRVLEQLATGLLLSQIGKEKVPVELLENSEVVEAEDYRLYQTYVMEGVKMLRDDPSIDSQVITVVEYHRERLDGSGFPKGVTGDKIPLLGKIAGLVDRFQELIKPRPGLEPLSPSQAMSALFKVSNVEFQADLLELFISALGVYPTGSIVELTSRDIGVVVHPNENRKLWPSVMLIGGSAQNNKMLGKLVNLQEFNEKQSSEAKYVQIADTLPQDSYCVDPGQLQMAVGGGWSLKRFF